MISSDWRLVKIQDLVDEGVIAKPLDGNHGAIHPKESDYVEEGIAFIMANDIKNGIVDLKRCKFIKREQADSLQKGFAKEGDVLLTHKGTVGNVTIVPKLNDDYIMLTPQVTYYRVIDQSKLINRYLKSYFESPNFQRTLKLYSGGGTRAYIGITAQRELQILLPPLPEQRKIAEILSTWDEAITLTERLIAAKQRRKKALMQQLLTGSVRFGEFEGEEWREVDLGDLATVRRGASPRPISDPKWFSEEGRGWIRIGDVTQSPTRFLNQTTQYLSSLAEEKSVKVEVGDLIMSICATIGVPKIVNIPACIHDGFVIFGSYEDKLDKEFLYHYLNLITDRLANRGQPGTQKNLNTSIVRKIKVPHLSLAEQKKITKVLTICEDEIFLLGQKLAALKRQKRGLMQKLLTGQVRVKVKEDTTYAME